VPIQASQFFNLSCLTQTALTTAEASVCLAVNQASSIQSIGGTCESITIGHNPSKLPLSNNGIFLDTCRPQFLCEKLLDTADEVEAQRRKANQRRGSFTRLISGLTRSSSRPKNDAVAINARSSAGLLGKQCWIRDFFFAW
jgi:hypothetical protein